MIRQRFVQNFAHRRAIVISRDGRALEALDQTLLKLGVSVSYVPLRGDRAAIGVEDLDPERDVLFVDCDLIDPFELPVNPVIVPIVALVGIEAPSRLRSLYQQGTTAILRKPVHSAIVYSALVLGVNTYQRLQQMETSIEMQEQRRRQRRAVVKAIVRIMKVHRVDDDEAYRLLRRESMRARLSVEAYSERLIEQKIEESEEDLEPERKSTIAI
jgi:AmiR/NasT family two-component response regulator